ncbi:MAG: hypothetical protein JWN52_2519 [Actinomycetia bacterium]|nr:hypothetical protein [Actinomycetes bacterium]
MTVISLYQSGNDVRFTLTWPDWDTQRCLLLGPVGPGVGTRL